MTVTRFKIGNMKLLEYRVTLTDSVSNAAQSPGSFSREESTGVEGVAIAQLAKALWTFFWTGNVSSGPWYSC